MHDTGYTIEELDIVRQNNEKAISIGINSLARIRELLDGWKIRPIDIEVCLQTAKNGIEKIEDVLRHNPIPASTREWLETKRQGRRKK